MKSIALFIFISAFGIYQLSQAAPVSSTTPETALSTERTVIDTLSETDETGVRVKRQGGCGCCGCGCCGCGGGGGCGCCCCRPKCCCRCTCCRTCCCTRCCTCCRPCCCRPCCCGCCGCGGGRKRRSLENLRIQLAIKLDQAKDKKAGDVTTLAPIPVVNTAGSSVPVHLQTDIKNNNSDDDLIANDIDRDHEWPTEISSGNQPQQAGNRPEQSGRNPEAAPTYITAAAPSDTWQNSPAGYSPFIRNIRNRKLL